MKGRFNVTEKTFNIQHSTLNLEGDGAWSIVECSALNVEC
jgi:hypothetical protein